MNILGYLRWCARGMLREPLAWGLVMNILAALAYLGGCPAPWPQAMAVFGIAITVFAALYYLVSVTYHQYRREQQNVLDQLRRK